MDSLSSYAFDVQLEQLYLFMYCLSSYTFHVQLEQLIFLCTA
jgi:hypothetical protein